MMANQGKENTTKPKQHVLEELGEVGDHALFVRLGRVHHVLRIEQGIDLKLVPRQLKGEGHLLLRVLLPTFLLQPAHRVGRQHIRAVLVDQGQEGAAVCPGQIEIVNVHARVPRRRTLEPEEQALLSIFRNGEAENDGPHQTQDQLLVRVHDVGGADVGQLQFLFPQVFEDEVAILKFMNAEFRSRVVFSLAQRVDGVTSDHLQ